MNIPPDFTIYIRTYKRDKIVTFQYIPPEWYPYTRLVVQERDKDRVKDSPVEKLVLPPEVDNLGKTMDWLMANCPTKKMLSLDDDITVNVLKNFNQYNLRGITPEEMHEALVRCAFMLDIYPHFGAGDRREAHIKYLHRILECTRCNRWHGFNVEFFRKNCPDFRFASVPNIEDYNMILYLLTHGYPNAIDCQLYIGDAFGSNSPGGCHDLREELGDGYDAKALQTLYPAFVSLETKETKTKGGIWNRTDVRVQWKKAYEYGMANWGLL